MPTTSVRRLIPAQAIEEVSAEAVPVGAIREDGQQANNLQKHIRNQMKQSGAQYNPDLTPDEEL
jgi:hypothetical protein